MKKLLLPILFFLFSAGIYAQKDTAVQKMVSSISKPPVDSSILIVVDGRVVGTIRELKMDIRNQFPVDIIERIEILKDYRATDKYGDKGKGGVIEFYLKGVKITDVNTPYDKDPVDNTAFNKVDVEASFPGGDKGWRSYLERNLNANVPVDNGAPEGTYIVMVQFIVDKDGTISDIKALTNHGYGLEEEVTKIIGEGPKWLPAIYNGQQVRAFRKQPVTFVVMSDREFKLSTDTIFTGKPTSVELLEMNHVKDEDIEVTVSYGNITYDSGKKYIITVDKPGKISLTVTRKAKKKKDQYEYGTVEIVVK